MRQVLGLLPAFRRQTQVPIDSPLAVGLALPDGEVAAAGFAPTRINCPRFTPFIDEAAPLHGAHTLDRRRLRAAHLRHTLPQRCFNRRAAFVALAARPARESIFGKGSCDARDISALHSVNPSLISRIYVSPRARIDGFGLCKASRSTQ